MRALDPGVQEPQLNVANNLARFWRWAKNVTGTISVQKRTEVTIETEQVVVIGKRQRSVRSWCQECCREVDMAELLGTAADSFDVCPLCGQMLQPPANQGTSTQNKIGDQELKVHEMLNPKKTTEGGRNESNE